MKIIDIYLFLGINKHILNGLLIIPLFEFKGELSQIYND